MRNTVPLLLLALTGCGTGRTEYELVVDPTQWTVFEVMTHDGERYIAGTERLPDYTRLLFFEPGEVAFFEGTDTTGRKFLEVFDPPLDAGDHISVFTGARQQLLLCPSTCATVPQDSAHDYTLHTKPAAQ